MPRLYRPHIPVEVRCRVALRQLGEMWPDQVIAARRHTGRDAHIKSLGVLKSNSGGLGALLDESLAKLADLLNCEVGRLRLDHNPALGAREIVAEGIKNGKRWATYRPDANNLEFLIYREKHAHHIKTNVRGDGAQHPDRVLIKRERRRKRENTLGGRPVSGKRFRWAKHSRGLKGRPKVKIRSRGFRKVAKQRRRQLPIPPRRMT
jgi:hypothetical protein